MRNRTAAGINFFEFLFENSISKKSKSEEKSVDILILTSDNTFFISVIFIVLNWVFFNLNPFPNLLDQRSKMLRKIDTQP